MRTTPRDCRDLRVWQHAMELVRVSYELTRAFPKHEIFGLTAQIRRAAASVPANIAEGNGRFGRGDYVRFLSYANGSLRELETHLLIARELGYLTSAEINRPLALAATTSGEVVRLARALKGSPA